MSLSICKIDDLINNDGCEIGMPFKGILPNNFSGFIVDEGLEHKWGFRSYPNRRSREAARIL